MLYILFYTLGIATYALGVATGIYITSIHFRIRVNRSFNRFVLWVRRLIERRETIRKLRATNKKLRGIADTVSYRKKLDY
jgi:hypothetical protein